MKIFITGASGFVGNAVARHLTKNQHKIIAMARSNKSSEKVKATGAEPRICDLLNVSSEHLEGCEVVIHCAAYAEEWGTENDFYQANVEGTKRLLSAANDAGIKTFISIGTEAALFKGQDMIDIDESYPYADDSPYPYSRTKGQAESLVLAANTDDFKTISLRPRMIWGPGDQSILPTILSMIKSKQFIWIGRGQFKTSTTHITNLVHAIELALTRGTGGQSYFIADNEEHSLKEFLTLYIKTQIEQVPDHSIPKNLARFFARIIEWIWKVFLPTKKPPMVRFTIDIMSAHCTVNTTKARNELGYAPVISVKDGLESMPQLPAR